MKNKRLFSISIIRLIFYLTLILCGAYIGWVLYVATNPVSYQISQFFSDIANILVVLIALYGLSQWRRERLFISKNNFNFFKVKHRASLKKLAHNLYVIIENDIYEPSRSDPYEPHRAEFQITKESLDRVSKVKDVLDQIINEIDAAIVELCMFENDKQYMFWTSENIHFVRGYFSYILKNYHNTMHTVDGVGAINIDVDYINCIHDVIEFLTTRCSIDKKLIEQLVHG